MRRERETRSQRLAIMREEIHLEFEIAWQRKTSLENRAFAVFTLNLALATLYLAIRPELPLTEIKIWSFSFWWLMGTFAFLVASTVGAVFAALPRVYPKLKVPRMSSLAKQADSNTHPYDRLFVDARLGLLEKTHKRNQSKANLMFWVLVCSGLMVVGFAGVFLFNSLSL